MKSVPAIHVAAGAERQATDALYRRHGRTVVGICRRLLRDAVEAEDATQQVFLSAHRALLRGAAPRDPLAWLATIARNECLARIRARASMPLPVPADAVDGVAPDVSSEATERAEVRIFWQALGDLPDAQRDAVVLRELRGLSYAQVAEQLALSHAAVRSLLGRARQRLRRQLGDVHSGLGGVSWLELLARLFAGGGGSAAPVAAKAVAVGLGAAALTGGAVVTPEVLRHHVRQVPAPRAAPRPAHRDPPARTVPRRVSPSPVVLRPDPVRKRQRPREHVHRARIDADRSGPESRPATDGRPGRGREGGGDDSSTLPVSVSAVASSGEGDGTVVERNDSGEGEGGGSRSGSGSDGSGESGSSGGDSGSGDSGSSGDG